MTSGEIAVLAKTGNGFNGIQTLLRYRGSILRLETIEFVCL
jgi:hypothetical protein